MYMYWVRIILFFILYTIYRVLPLAAAFLTRFEKLLGLGLYN